MDISLADVKRVLCDQDTNGLLGIHQKLSQLLLQTIQHEKASLKDKLSSYSIDQLSMTFLPMNSVANCQSDETAISLVSKSNGNCLYNSASILIIGTDNLASVLRALVSIELFLHRQFYAKHPYLEEKISAIPDKSLLEFCLKSISTDGVSHEEAICREAISNCNTREWSSMICMFALSSVLKSPIKSIYPTTSTIYSILFNGVIQPRVTPISEPMKHIMWTKSLSFNEIGGTFRSNHFVPVISRNNALLKLKKRKSRDATPTSKRQKSLDSFVSKETPSTTLPKIEIRKTKVSITGTNSVAVVSSDASSSSYDIQRSEENLASKPHPIKGDKYDIFNVFEQLSDFSDAGKLDFIHQNVSKDYSDYEFPRSGTRKLHCRDAWLKKNDWLVYSETADSLYCISCIMFPPLGGQEPKLTSKDGLRTWSVATGRISNHATKSPHQLSYSKFVGFKDSRQDPSKSINVLMNKAEAEKIEKNRSRLLTVIKCVLYLGKQGLAFRGHREDGEYLDDPSNNPGNFKALLKLLESLGNEDISYLLRSAPRNSTYTSKTICDQIVDVIGDYVTEKVLCDIKKSKFFSIIADEALDVSKKEQLALVLRFVDSDFTIREEFIKFLHCASGLSGESLAQLILDEIEALGLCMSNCRGQGYDGAGAMAGSNKGVSSRIAALYPKALFIHCFSHRLNLSTMMMIQVKPVRDMFDNVRVISDFFNNSAKRYERFQEMIEKCLSKDESVHKLLDICRTRWLERIEGLSRFKDAFSATHKALTSISTNDPLHNNEWNAESRATATGLSFLMQKFEFIFCIVVCHEIMQYLYGLTISLQSSTLAIIEAYQSVLTVIETLNGLKANVDEHHLRWYNEAVKLAKLINVEPSVKRTCITQHFRSNTPYTDTSSYYRRSVTLPVLNEVIEDLKRRFSSSQTREFISGFYCIPQIMEKYPKEWKSKLLFFMKMYKDDLPHYTSCRAEVDCWETYWLKDYKGESPATLQDTLKTMKVQMYPNICAVLKLLGTVPVTTCTCERCMSVLRRLKTYLRSTMNQEKFTDLATLHIHYGLHVDENEVLDRLIVKYPKRVRMNNILED